MRFRMHCALALILSFPVGRTPMKGDDQYPVLAPPFIARGFGCHVWELEGNGMALRSVALGHAYPAVLAAAIREMRRGANFTRPSPLEGECAEHLLEFVPGAEMAKFTKDGSAATTAAVRLARAYTGRDTVALCADHAFYSYDDWARQSVRHRWMLAYRGKQVVRR